MNKLEKTFAELLQCVELEQVTIREGEKLGWVYFIACKETMRCKIGYTKSNVAKRLKALQTGSAGELRLMAMHPGTPNTERALHARFADKRIHGEWFEASGELLAYLWATVWVMARICAKQGRNAEPWMKAGLRMMEEESGPLPDDLTAFIAGEAHR